MNTRTAVMTKANFMSNQQQQLRAFLSAGFLLAGLFSASCATNETEIPVKLSDLPSAAQKSVQAQLTGGKLSEITKITDEGVTFYDVEMTRDARSRSFTVSAEGDLVEEQVFLRELPHAVRKAIHTQVGDGHLGEITRSTEDGETTYDVEMTKAGRTRDFSVGQDGELLQVQVFLEETPAEIQKAVQKEVGDGKCGDIHKTTEDGDVSYDVEMTRSGTSRSLTFDSKGALVFQQEPVTLAAAPEPVQQALKRESIDVKLAFLYKTIEDDETSYQVRFVKAGKRQSLTLSPDGKVLPSGGK
jgi:uncharacterized membrane protein YkoI